MALENKKLSTYGDITSLNIDGTTKLVALTGTIKENVNIPLAIFIEDSLTSTSVLKPLSANKGKDLNDRVSIIENTSITNLPNVGGMVPMDSGNTDFTFVPIQNNLTTATGVSILDARQGKILNDKFTPIQSDILSNKMVVNTLSIGVVANQLRSIHTININGATFDLLLDSSSVGSEVIIKNGNITGSIIICGGTGTIDGQDVNVSLAGTAYSLTGAYAKLHLVKISSTEWAII